MTDLPKETDPRAELSVDHVEADIENREAA